MAIVSLVAEETNAQLTDQIYNQLKRLLRCFCLEDTSIDTLKFSILASASRFASFFRISEILEVNVSDT